MTINTKLIQALEQLEAEMRRCELWQSEPPSAEAMSSTEPFSIDKLEAHEWLQWVFLPAMQQRLNAQQPIPRGFELSPYFEEVWKNDDTYHPVLVVVRAIDKVCQ